MRERRRRDEQMMNSAELRDEMIPTSLMFRLPRDIGWRAALRQASAMLPHYAQTLLSQQATAGSGTANVAQRQSLYRHYSPCRLAS